MQAICSTRLAARSLVVVALFAAQAVLAQAPTITSFSPASGPIGGTVVIKGTNLTTPTAVKFAGVAATTFTANSATQITATVPATGTGTISVTTAGGTATSATSFTMVPSMTRSPTLAHPEVNVAVVGAGFSAYTAIDIYWDTTDVVLGVSNAQGVVSASVPVPASAQPGNHWITLVERANDQAAQGVFTVNTSWVVSGFTSGGTGWNSYENTISAANAADLAAVWSGNSGGYANPSPFVELNGYVYVGDVNGNVHAYNGSGTLLWTASTSDDFQSVAPATTDNLVFFGGSNGVVYAYKSTCRSDGGVCTPTWTTPVADSVTGNLNLYNGTLYVPTSDGSIHTLNPATGVQGTAVHGFDTTQGSVTTAPSFDTDGSFYYATSGNVVEYYLAPDSYGYFTFNGTASSIVVRSGGVYFTTSDGHLHRATYPGWITTISSDSGCVAAAPVLADGILWAGGCTSLGAYNPTTGDEIVSISTGQVQGLAAANGLIYACVGPTDSGLLYAYSATTLEVVWDSGGPCNGAPEVANGVVYAANGEIIQYAPLQPAGTNAANSADVQPPRISSLVPDYHLMAQKTPEVLPR